jgi:anti-sigma factor RsiW
MDCRQLQDLLPLHAVNETRVEESLAVEEHLEGCDACREELATYRRICETASRELAEVPGVPAGTQGRVLQETEDRGAGLPAPLPIRPGRGRWVPALALAATFLVAGVLVGRWSAAPADRPPSAPSGSLSDRLTLAPLRQALNSEINTAAFRRPTLSVFSRAARSFLTQAVQDEDEREDGAGGAVRPPGGAVPGVDG